MKKSTSARHVDVSKLSKSCLALNPHLTGGQIVAGIERLATQQAVLAEKGAGTPEKEKKGPQMTQAEREFKAMLEREFPLAKVIFSRYTFILTTDCRYTPDFAVIHWSPNFPERPPVMQFFEVKGAHLYKGATKSATHTSLTKPKLAAELFPWHTFHRATKSKDGSWSREKYSAAT